MDMSSITAAYGALKAIKELGSAALDAESKQKIPEVMSKVGAVQDALFYLREEMLNLQEENHKLKDEVKSITAKLEEHRKVVWERPSYWVYEDGNKEGPFCQKCFDVDKRLVRLQDGENDVWACHSCGSLFYGPQHVHPGGVVTFGPDF